MTSPERGIIQEERPQQCDMCGECRELRPYGPGGACVCFDCGMKDEAGAVRHFNRRLEPTHD